MKKLFTVLLLLSFILPLFVLSACDASKAPEDGDGAPGGGETQSGDETQNGDETQDSDKTASENETQNGVEVQKDGFAYRLNDDGESYTVVGIGEVTAEHPIIPALYKNKPVTKIDEGAFAGCTDVLGMTLSEGITEIGEGAFEGCTSLSTVFLPQSLTSVGARAFLHCVNLSTLRFGGTSLAWNALEKGEDWDTQAGKYAVTYARYAVTLLFPNGNTPVICSVLPNTAFTPPEELPIPEGYEVIGWDSDGNGFPDTKHTKVTSDMTLHALIWKKTYTVTFLFIAPDGTEAAETIWTYAEHGSTVTLPENPPGLEGYDIIGWDANGDGVADASFGGVTKNLTIRAILQKQKTDYSVSFTFIDPKGNVLAAPIIRNWVKRGGEAPPPNGYVNNVQLFENYVIIGWDSNGDGKADAGYKRVTHDMEVKALLRAKANCTVTFLDSNGTPIPNGRITVKEGTRITDEMIAAHFEIPKVTGKYFIGWMPSADSASDITCIRDSCTFKAMYLES